MADPTTNLPQLVTNFVPRGPTPYGNPGALAPVVPPPPVSSFVSRQATGARGYTTGVPPTLPVMAAAPQPANAPVATSVAPGAPVDNGIGVSPTPGAGNPLPPSMRGGVPLPGGDIGGVPAGQPAARAQTVVPAFPLLTPPALGTVFSAGAGGRSQIDPSGIEVDRGGVVSRYDGSGNLTSGPGGQGEAAYNALIAANPNNGVGQLGVAYGQAVPTPGAAGGVPAGAAGAAVGGLRDPSGAINAGFDTQTARAQNFIDQARQYVDAGDNIFERATRGRFINGLLSATVGPNNVGQVQGQGADTLNSAIAGITSSGIGASASEYGSQLGYQASAERNTAAEHLENVERQNTPVTIGQRFVNNGMGLIVPQPIMGLPTLDQSGAPTGYRTLSPNGMVVTPRAAAAPANPTVGTTRTRASGAVERFDGRNWTSETSR